jgi:two-component system, OmpR family, sensor histidine kinase MtrB
VSPTAQVDSRLGAVAAFVRALEGADDAVSLLHRARESISEQLGLECTVVRGLAEDGNAVTAVAGHGRDSERELIASADELPLLREAKQTGAPTLTDAAGTETWSPEETVVVPLIAAGQRLGFLRARAGSPAELDIAQREVLDAVCGILASHLRRALVCDDLREALRRKSDFVAIAAHELRRPAAALCGVAATLDAHEVCLTGKQRRTMLDMLSEQGRVLHGLVDQLLNLSRLEARSIRITPTSFSVRRRTEGIVRNVASERADEITIGIAGDLRVHADPDAFDRIVSNLIANALRYGRRPIAITAGSRDRHFRLAVEDRGPGVPRDFAPHLFDPFARGDDAGLSGSGLGLSIAQAYAHAHGGWVVYQDAVPHGACFELVIPTTDVRFPADSRAKRAAGARAAAKGPARPGRRRA